jgi:hypothetical protein
MSAAKCGGVFAGVGLLIGLLWPAGSLPSSCAQGPEDKKYYFGNTNCKACHEYESVAEAGKKLSVVFMRGTEMHTWSAQDKHRHASTVLLGERGKLMARNLGLNIDKILAEKQCISCHGVYVDETKDQFDEQSFSAEQRAESGVSCVLCHGPAATWVQEHQTFPVKWQKLTRVEKVAKGLNDLWDPQRRAALCCSCHVGDAKEGRVVTHEMYAAGHPPLPSIEVATFCDAMPRHWETWPEKLQRLKQDLEAAANDKGAGAKKKQELIAKRGELYRHSYQFDTQPSETQQLDLTVTASLVVFRESMRLLAAQAKQGAETRDQTKAWPEFAAFDCYACHHDLKADSWRQKRGYKGAPAGRPDMPAWPSALLPLGLQHVALCNKQPSDQDQAELKEKLQQLQKAFTSQPFGDPHAIAAKATELEKWSDVVLTKLQKCRGDLASTQPLLRGLLELPAQHLLDFDSARQVSWAFGALAPELRPDLFRRKPGLAVIDGNPERLSAEQCKALAGLNDTLQLELPKEQKPIAPDFLAKTLPKIAEYDPEPFRLHMATLRQALDKKRRE